MILHLLHVFSASWWCFLDLNLGPDDIDSMWSIVSRQVIYFRLDCSERYNESADGERAIAVQKPIGCVPFANLLSDNISKWLLASIEKQEKLLTLALGAHAPAQFHRDLQGSTIKSTGN